MLVGSGFWRDHSGIAAERFCRYRGVGKSAFVVERPAMTRIEFTVALVAMFQIQGWNVASALNFPQPGYVAIRPSNGPNGHMGILDFDGMAISAQADLVRSEHDT